MEFLPLSINEQKVYAGFWKRLGAALIDVLIFLPLLILVQWPATSIPIAIAGPIFSSIAIYAYTIYFHTRFGATLGKIAMGIKITLPDGSRIGLKQALLRSSVDLFFALLAGTAQLIAYSKADFSIYLSLGWVERADYLLLLFPAWYVLTNALSTIWYWGEFLVLLFNKRKRALHDFIAGTVVIHKEYAQAPSMIA